MGYYYSDEYLEHHGILGQKWGVRRFQRKDGTRTAAGKARQAENAKKSGLTDEQKKYLKIGAAVVGASLVAAGGVYLAKSGKLQAIGDKFVKKEIGDAGIPEDSSTPINTIADRITTVSKERDIITFDKDYLDMDDAEKKELVKTINSENGTYNCAACTAAYDLFRKTGKVFQIRANVDTAGFGRKEFMDKLYKDFTKFDSIKESKSCAEFSNKLLEKVGSKENVWGRVCLTGADGSSGHAISFYTQNGKLRLIDSQNKIDVSPEHFDLLLGSKFDWSSVEFARTDNLEFNDNGIEWLGRMAQRTKKKQEET